MVTRGRGGQGSRLLDYIVRYHPFNRLGMGWVVGSGQLATHGL